jgi:predicted nucleic acid-binding protein
MNAKRFFLDTVFLQAQLNPRDRHHARARAFVPQLREAGEVWVTEAVLVEVGNALSAVNRSAAAQLIQQCYQTANTHVVSIDTGLFSRAVQLYQSRPDKTWGLTDCISFVVMHDQNLTDAVTTDRHFVQAGFRALLLEGF